jgi:hypothetical protein
MFQVSPYSTGKLAGLPDKGKRKPKKWRAALQREQTLQAKSRENAGFNRGKQSCIATKSPNETRQASSWQQVLGRFIVGRFYCIALV